MRADMMYVSEDAYDALYQQVGASPNRLFGMDVLRKRTGYDIAIINSDDFHRAKDFQSERLKESRD